MRKLATAIAAALALVAGLALASGTASSNTHDASIDPATRSYVDNLDIY